MSSYRPSSFPVKLCAQLSSSFICLTLLSQVYFYIYTDTLKLMDDIPTMMNSSTSIFCNYGHGFQKQCKSKQLNTSFNNSQDSEQWQNCKKYLVLWLINPIYCLFMQIQNNEILLIWTDISYNSMFHPPYKAIQHDTLILKCLPVKNWVGLSYLLSRSQLKAKESLTLKFF